MCLDTHMKLALYKYAIIIIIIIIIIHPNSAKLKWQFTGAWFNIKTVFLGMVISVGDKLSWFIRHLSDGLYIFYINLWNLPPDIWA